jgi:hypothetical protein
VIEEGLVAEFHLVAHEVPGLIIANAIPERRLSLGFGEVVD